MYCLQDLKRVTKDTVQKELYFMLSCHCYYSFFIDKCPECGKSTISIHEHHESTMPYRSIAYFVCKCGNRWKKTAWTMGDGKKPAHYKLKQYGAGVFVPRDLKKNKYVEYDGIKLSNDKYLLVTETESKIVSSEDYKQIRIEDTVGFYKRHPSYNPDTRDKKQDR